jgi:beta-lysine 5,6-aminomutase alpha subunit
VQDALFNMVTILTGQKIHLLGMMTEAIHTPFMSDRALAIENAQYIFRTMADFGSEIEYKQGGIIQSRAAEVLQKAADLLKEIERTGLFRHARKGRVRGHQASAGRRQGTFRRRAQERRLLQSLH